MSAEQSEQLTDVQLKPVQLHPGYSEHSPTVFPMQGSTVVVVLVVVEVVVVVVVVVVVLVDVVVEVVVLVVLDVVVDPVPHGVSAISQSGPTGGNPGFEHGQDDGQGL